jgi:HD-GYP domain-containing protein (c-di-GMP phosphodiesterase class II)
MDIPREFYEAIDAKAMAVLVALDERDRLTCRHCNRVAALAVELGRQSGLSERDLKALHIAAGFHDIGKIGIPDSVLKKPTPFDDDDWAIMKTHPARSERIILAAGLKDGDVIALAVRHHHERYDGGGYPDGLAGDAIPILGRMVAIVDAYDAMATARHHGHAKTHAEIMEELRQEQGRQHDASLFGQLSKVFEQHPHLKMSVSG